jgi:hypothetical protein
MKSQRNILVSVIMLMAFMLVGTIGIGTAAYAQHSIDIHVEEFDCPLGKYGETKGCGRRRKEPGEPLHI